MDTAYIRCNACSIVCKKCQHKFEQNMKGIHIGASLGTEQLPKLRLRFCLPGIVQETFPCAGSLIGERLQSIPFIISPEVDID